MKRRTKFSIIFIVALLLMLTIAFIFANRWTKNFQRLLETQGAVEHAKVNGVVITETKDSVKDWEVYATTAEYDENRVTAIMYDIIGNYYKNNEVIMSFTAPKGTYNSENKKIELLENVKVVGKDDVTLTCNKISWVTTSNKIYADGNVVIEKGNEVVAMSNHASITTDFTQIEIRDNTELRIYSTSKNNGNNIIINNKKNKKNKKSKKNK